jgi:hypothetical protein
MFEMHKRLYASFMEMRVFVSFLTFVWSIVSRVVRSVWNRWFWRVLLQTLLASQVMRVLTKLHRYHYVKKPSYMLWFNTHFARFIDRLTTRKESVEIRGKFAEAMVSFNKRNEKSHTHTHPTLAKRRKEFIQIAFNLAAQFSLKPLFINPRPTMFDEVDCSGEGEFYNVWHIGSGAKGGILPTVRGRVPENGIIVVIDSDHSFNLASLTNYGVPVLVLAFTPSVVSAIRKDYSFCFTGNRVKFQVSGGANYVHPVTKITSDHVVFDSWLASTTSLVECRSFGQDFSVYLLVPSAVIWFVGKLRPGPAVGTLRPNRTPGFSAITTFSPGKVKVSLGVEGSMLSYKIDESLLAATHQQSVASKAYGPASVESVLRANKVGPANRDQDAPPLCKYALINVASLTANYVKAGGKPDKAVGVPKTNIVPDLNDSRRTYTGPSAHDTDVLTLRPWCRPIFDATLPNQRGLNAEANTVIDRVARPQHAIQGVSRVTTAHILQFCKFLCAGHEGTLVPVTFDEVESHQDTASKRRNFHQGMQGMTSKGNFARSFIKAETSSLSKPERGGRLITTYASDHKLVMSQFSISLYNWMCVQRTHLIGSGHPRLIADRVANITANNNWVMVADASSFDGRLSEWHITLETQVMLSLFAPEYHSVIRAIMHEQTELPAITSSGIRYNTGFSRHSGSPFTTISNTVCSLFLIYEAYRTIFDAEEAGEMMHIGAIASGDDILAGEVSEEMFEPVIRKYKMDYKMRFEDYGMTDHSTGPMGADFLAVYYPEPGNAHVLPDLVRILSKFHWTAQKAEVPQAEVAFNKSVSLLITYGHHGLCGKLLLTIVEKVVEHYPDLKFGDLEGTNYVSRPFLVEHLGKIARDRFWLEGEPSMYKPLWPCFENDEKALLACEAEGINLRILNEHLEKPHSTLEQLLDFPLCGFVIPPSVVPKGHSPVIIDDTFIGADGPTLAPVSTLADKNDVPPGTVFPPIETNFGEPKFVLPKTGPDNRLALYDKVLHLDGPRVEVEGRTYQNVVVWLETEFSFDRAVLKDLAIRYLDNERKRHDLPLLRAEPRARNAASRKEAQIAPVKLVPPPGFVPPQPSSAANNPDFVDPFAKLTVNVAPPTDLSCGTGIVPIAREHAEKLEISIAPPYRIDRCNFRLPDEVMRQPLFSGPDVTKLLDEDEKFAVSVVVLQGGMDLIYSRVATLPRTKLGQHRAWAIQEGVGKAIFAVDKYNREGKCTRFHSYADRVFRGAGRAAKIDWADYAVTQQPGPLPADDEPAAAAAPPSPPSPAPEKKAKPDFSAPSSANRHLARPAKKDKKDKMKPKNSQNKRSSTLRAPAPAAAAPEKAAAAAPAPQPAKAAVPEKAAAAAAPKPAKAAPSAAAAAAVPPPTDTRLAAELKAARARAGPYKPAFLPKARL